MKILIDIGHPAHVHYFKNFIKIMKGKGHNFIIIARDKEMTHYLLNELKLQFHNRGKGKNNPVGKLLYMLKADVLLFKKAKEFKPDIFMSFGSPYAAQVSTLMGKPHIVFDDTENAKFGQLFYKPFSETIISPTTFKPDFGIKHIKYDSYIELCYLHPKYFKPKKEIVLRNGINPDKKYVILRFVAWNANHDIGHTGISIDNKIQAVKRFLKFADVYISSESILPSELEKYRLKINPKDIHHILSFATLFYGESATMASESVILGTPAIYLDNAGRGYTDEQEEKYKMVFNFSESIIDQRRSIDKGVEILQLKKDAFVKNKEKLLNDKIIITDFMVWFVDNYPESFKKMKKTSEYQYRFK